MGMEQNEPGEEGLRCCRGVICGCGLTALVVIVLGGLALLCRWVGLL